VTILSNGTESVEPVLWLTQTQKYESQNRVHRLLNGKIAVTLAPPAPRAGVLGLLFDTEAGALACIGVHRTGDLFQISDPEQPTLNMIYVLAEGGGLDMETLTEEARLWIVRIDYQEVTE
jgi:hypothetical protein